MTDGNVPAKIPFPLAEPSPVAAASTDQVDLEIISPKNNHRGRGRGGRWEKAGSKRKNTNQGRAAYKYVSPGSFPGCFPSFNAPRNNTRRNKDSTWGPRNAEGGVAVKDDKEEEKEQRKPKKKVAVLIGYCGTGYRGMQLNPPHKSIEGDLFEAFVRAGAISGANSDDPKKSSLVRCARTDKGVHAAGNVISLKLIVEEPDIVAKINSYLPEQIRVWGIVRTVGSFSSYQQCDSRRYEYLVPSHCFLPPHPKSYLAKVCREVAEREGDLEGFLARNKEVEGWWEEVNKKVYEKLSHINRDVLDMALEYEVRSEDATVDPEKTHLAVDPAAGDETNKDINVGAGLWKQIGTIYRTEKKTYRISQERLAKVREAFKSFEGTVNFHNYTIQKTFRDPSSKRFIKSFEVLDPIIINDTEWLSLRVHGQSFMMHQIRKMVGMVMMVIRTGCPLVRIKEACGPRIISIPKAPSLGLLLESPVFDAYNRKAERDFQRKPIDFSVHTKEINAFREQMIYSKLFEEEERAHVYTQFVHFIDSFRSPLFHYLTSAGLGALDHTETDQGEKVVGLQQLPDDDSDDDDGAASAEGG